MVGVASAFSRVDVIHTVFIRTDPSPLKMPDAPGS
jgi:hypothetical protein